MYVERMRILFVALLVTALAACAHRSATSTATASRRTAVDALDDRRIVAVLFALGQIEIEESDLADSRAGSPDVRRFAADMVRTHREHARRLDAIVVRNALPAESCPMAQAIVARGDDVSDGLSVQNGNEFDREYLRTQIEAHRAAIRTVDEHLIPFATNLDLAHHVAVVRAALGEHLARAERLARDFEPTLDDRIPPSSAGDEGDASVPPPRDPRL